MSTSAIDQPDFAGMAIDTPNNFLKKSSSFKSPVPKQKPKDSHSKSPPVKDFLRPHTPPSNSKFPLREPPSNYEKHNIFASPAAKVLASGYSSMHTLKVPSAVHPANASSGSTTFVGVTSQA